MKMFLKKYRGNKCPLGLNRETGKNQYGHAAVTGSKPFMPLEKSEKAGIAMNWSQKNCLFSNHHYNLRVIGTAIIQYLLILFTGLWPVLLL